MGIFLLSLLSPLLKKKARHPKSGGGGHRLCGCRLQKPALKQHLEGCQQSQKLREHQSTRREKACCRQTLRQQEVPGEWGGVLDKIQGGPPDSGQNRWTAFTGFVPFEFIVDRSQGHWFCLVSGGGGGLTKSNELLLDKREVAFS